MLSYRNEAAFSKALVQAMRLRRWFVQRIESGTTGKGIPDLYVVTPKGHACWIELKREKRFLSQEKVIEISWRPGQQSWLSTVTSYKQIALTIACFNDGIVSIRHDRIWVQNKVPIAFCNYYKDIRSLLSE